MFHNAGIFTHIFPQNDPVLKLNLLYMEHMGYVKHPLRNHNLVGHFHIIGTIDEVFDIRVMGLGLP